MSDGRVTDGHGRIVVDTCQKGVVLGSCVALVAGEDGRALQDLAEAGCRTYAHIVEYVKHRLVTDENHNWTLLIWDRASQTLYGLDGDGTEVEYPTSATSGSGGNLAEGALAAMPRPKSLDEARKQAQKALRIACAGNALCGGKTRWWIVRGKRKALEIG
jgi:ATP-dependent protease HslVU (ClpYQ) peptidase subunit